MRTSSLLAGIFAFWISPVMGNDPCDIYSRYQNDPVLMTIVSFMGIETQSYQEKRCRLEQEAYTRYLSLDGLYSSNKEVDSAYRERVDRFSTDIIASDTIHSDASLAFEVRTDSGKPTKTNVFETGEGFISRGVLSD